jgi:hypothetical protein
MGNERHLLEELKEQNATDAGAISNSSFRNEKKFSVSLLLRRVNCLLQNDQFKYNTSQNLV